MKDGRRRKAPRIGIRRRADDVGLPNELWALVLSFFDVSTLCTVRLVSKNLRQLASELIRQLHVDCRMLQAHPAANFQLFPAAAVHVRGVALSTLHLLNAQPLASAVASIAMLPGETPVLRRDSQQLAVFSALPTLRCFAASPPISAFTTLPQTLRALVLGVTHNPNDFNAIANFSQLTRLQLEYGMQSVRPLNVLGRLPQLKQLTLKFSFELLSLLAPLTNLENLALQAADSTWEQYRAVNAFTRLHPIPSFTKLTSLSLDGGRTYRFPVFNLLDLSVLTGLCQLTVRDAPDPQVGALYLTSHLSGLLRELTSLSDLGFKLPADSDILGPDLAANMRSLSIESVKFEAGVDGLSRLRPCTALTRLELYIERTGSISEENPDFHLETVASLTRLRSLSLVGNCTKLRPPAAGMLHALTGLTALSVQKWGFTDADVAACAALDYLRDLRLAYEPLVTAATIPHLYRLTRLSYLELNSTGLVAEVWTPEVLAQFDDFRRARGWPPLRIECRREPQWPGGEWEAPWDGVPPSGGALGND